MTDYDMAGLPPMVPTQLEQLVLSEGSNRTSFTPLVFSTPEPQATVSIVMSTRKRRPARSADVDFDYDMEEDKDEEDGDGKDDSENVPSKLRRKRSSGRTRSHDHRNAGVGVIGRSASTPVALTPRSSPARGVHVTAATAAAAVRPLMRRSNSAVTVRTNSSSSQFKYERCHCTAIRPVILALSGPASCAKLFNEVAIHLCTVVFCAVLKLYQ